MKIFLPFSLKDIGGPSSFAKKFKQGLEQRGHQVFFDFQEEYDVLFLIVQCPLRYLMHAKRNRRPIVQRLDGVYYWSVSGWKFPLMNAKATYIRHLFTDFTVYQSEYSRRCVERFLGRKNHERSALIYNGVDTNSFSPTGATANVRDNAGQAIFFTASAFRRTDQIVPLLVAVNDYRSRFSTNCKLVIAGSFVGEVADLPDRLGQLPYVQLLGKVGNTDLPAYERAADVFVFTHMNPPCPNNVIEAMACGLPICGVADGAMTELVQHGSNGLLVQTQGDAFWGRRNISTKQFVVHLRQIMERRREYASISRQLVEEKFSLELMIDKYLEALYTAIQ